MLRTWLARLLPLWATLFVLLVLVPIFGVAVKYSNWIMTGVLPDFREGKVSAIESLPIWLKRSQISFQNSLSLFRGDAISLPVVNLFIPERSMESLLGNLPSSAKKYQQAQMLFPDGKIERIKVRIRGDNGRNYLLGKKSWKIKTKKSKLYHGSRNFSFHVPRKSIPVETVAAYRVSQKLGLVTPDSRLVELKVNGSNYGVFLQLMHLNEGFLRKHGFMPVEIFKSDREIGDERASTNRVWQNISRWKVLAQSGRYSDEKRLLKRGLDLLNSAVFDGQSYRELKLVFPIDVWAKYAVQDILLENFHTGNHNLRIIADDQSGFIIPIIWDPTIRFNDDNMDFVALLSECRVPIVCLYKQSSEFRKREFELLHKAVKDNTLGQVASEIEKDLNSITESINRDAYRFDVERNRSDIFGKSTRNTILGFANELRARENSLMLMLEEEPRVSWQAGDNRIELYIKGPIPIDQIYLFGKGFNDIKHIYYDKNNNGEIDTTDERIPIVIKDNTLIVDVSLLPNFSDLKDNLPTRFVFLFDSDMQISAINVRQSLTKHRYQAPKSGDDYQTASLRNTPIVQRNERSPVIVKSILEVRQTLVTEKPYIFMPGSGMIIHPGVSVIFRKRVEFRGSRSDPITITSHSMDPFGVVAIHGNDASGSIMKHVAIENGSQSEVNGISYLGMLSIHNSSNILIEHLRSSSNSGADDMFHVVYGRNIILRNSQLHNAQLDAIDFDLSTIEVDGLTITRAGNDCIDVMGGSVRFRNVLVRQCGDKGISVGEKSKTEIVATTIENASIGLAAKDGSTVSITDSYFKGNSTHLDSYLKNWRYGQSGATISVKDSQFLGVLNHFQTDTRSSIAIESSQLPNGYTTEGNVLLRN